MPVQRALPRPTPETRHFWEGTLAGELRFQRCRRCELRWLPPQPSCPDCGASDIELQVASGRGRLHSYVIHHRDVPGYAAPYVIAVVELEEGPRLLSNLVEVEPDPAQLPVDLPLELVFEQVGEEIALPRFRPLRGGA